MSEVASESRRSGSSSRVSARALPPIAAASLPLLTESGFSLERDQMAADIPLRRPDGRKMTFYEILGDETRQDWGPNLEGIVEREVLAVGTRTQRGRYRREGAKTSATLPQAAKRLYREQRQALEEELAHTDDLELLETAGRMGSYARALLKNPLTPAPVVSRIADAWRKYDDGRPRLSASEMIGDNLPDLLCAHPNLEEQEIRHLFSHRRWGPDSRLASHPNLPRDLQHSYLVEGFRHSGTNIWSLRGLAENPSLDPEVAAALWHAVLNEEPAGVSRNDFLMAGRRFDDHRDQLLVSLASNGSTPQEILREMAAADEPSLDRALIQNPKLVEAVTEEAHQRIEVEGREDVVAALGEIVLYGDLEMLARRANYNPELLVRERDGRFDVDDRPWRASELEGWVAVPLPAEGGREERLLQAHRRGYEDDARTLRRRIRTLLPDWPVAYERALQQRRAGVEQSVAEAREGYDRTVDTQRQLLIDRLLVSVSDGLDIGEAARLGGISREDLERAKREREGPAPSFGW